MSNLKSFNILSIEMAQAYADRAKQLLAQGNPYPQGCSGFVCDVLQIPWQDANSLMGDNSNPIGTNGNYNNVNPGDIVGWVSATGSGHVAVYIGDPGMTFIDARQPGNSPRSLSSYGPQTVYKSTQF